MRNKEETHKRTLGEIASGNSRPNKNLRPYRVRLVCLHEQRSRRSRVGRPRYGEVNAESKRRETRRHTVKRLRGKRETGRGPTFRCLTEQKTIDQVPLLTSPT